MEKLRFMLLLVMDMDKLSNFYWKMEQKLILQKRFFFIIISFFFVFLILLKKKFSFFFFLFFYFFFFSFFFFFSSLFSFLFSLQKDGGTPLFIAVCRGFEQIVQILLGRGANPDLAMVFFLFFFVFCFLFFVFCFLFFVFCFLFLIFDF